MTAIPDKSALTGDDVTTGQYKANLNALHDYLTGLLGSTGAADDALAQLGLPQTANTYLRRSSDNTDYEAKTAQEVANEMAQQREFGYRNVIVDGDMTSFQEGESKTGRTSSYYVSDVFKHGISGSGTWTGQQVADHPILGSRGFCTEVLCTAADATVGAADWSTIDHIVEGFAYAPLYQNEQIISFWVKSNVTGVYCVGLRSGGADLSYISEISINAANTWEKKEIAITEPPSGGTWEFGNGKGVMLHLCLVAGTNFHATTTSTWEAANNLSTSNQVNLAGAVNNYLRITDVQLEKGSVATPFERLPPGEQYRRCLRYIEVPDPLINPVESFYFAASGALRYTSILFRERKRAVPIVSGVPTEETNAEFTGLTTNIDYIRIQIQSTATGHALVGVKWTADARL